VSAGRGGVFKRNQRSCSSADPASTSDEGGRSVETFKELRRIENEEDAKMVQKQQEGVLSAKHCERKEER